MNAGRFQINPFDLDDIATELERTYQTEFQVIASALGQVNTDLDAAWTGQAAHIFRAQFGDWTAQLGNMGADLPRIAIFLRSVAAEYRRLDGYRTREMYQTHLSRLTPGRGGGSSGLPRRAPGGENWSDSTVSGDPAQTWGSGAAFKVRVITPDLAQRIFNTLDNYTWDANNPNARFSWDYTPDGCWARAQLMRDVIGSEYGFFPYQIWLDGKLEPNVMYEGSPVNWGYHVAPLVRVQDERGNAIDMVIDPSLASEPVTVAVWYQLMNVTMGTAAYTITGPAHGPIALANGWPQEFSDEYARQVMENLNQCVLEDGWVSYTSFAPSEPDTCGIPDPETMAP